MPHIAPEPEQEWRNRFATTPPASKMPADGGPSNL
jgi:hypothetical protein